MKEDTDDAAPIDRESHATGEMCALVKPGGVLVCEDYDAASVASDPPTDAYRRLYAISGVLDRAHGVDSEIGPKLHRLFARVPVGAPRVQVRQPSFLTGPEKRLWELTLREAAPAVIEAGAGTQSELEDICSEMASIAGDSSIRVTVGHVWQTWACKIA